MSSVALQAANSTPPALHFTLEMRVAKASRVMSHRHVFHRGDQVRLRVRSDADGYLYVLNRSSSGSISLLFPADKQPNRIEPNHEIKLPGSEHDWFTIENPPGYETLYFLISPQPTSAPSVTAKAAFPMVAPAKKPAPGDEMLPRCDDDLFRARGECLDVGAGPRAVDAGEKLPANMSGSELISRDITISDEDGGVAVAPVKGKGAAVVYEFRIAHQ